MIGSGVITRAFEAGIGLEQRTLERMLDSGELDRALHSLFASRQVQAALRRAFNSEAAVGLVDTLVESAAFERLIGRLGSSPALWRLIDEIAASPAVTAAIGKQGLTFADQVGTEMRARSRRADDWLERAAHRVRPHDQGAPSSASDAPAP